MAHLDFKVTQWKRINVPDDKIAEVIERLKSGVDTEPYDLLEDEAFYYNQGGSDEECEEPMSIQENDGASTQELYNSDGEMLYSNGKNLD